MDAIADDDPRYTWWPADSGGLPPHPKLVKQLAYMRALRNGEAWALAERERRGKFYDRKAAVVAH